MRSPGMQHNFYETSTSDFKRPYGAPPGAPVGPGPDAGPYVGGSPPPSAAERAKKASAAEARVAAVATGAAAAKEKGLRRANALYEVGEETPMPGREKEYEAYMQSYTGNLPNAGGEGTSSPQPAVDEDRRNRSPGLQQNFYETSTADFKRPRRWRQRRRPPTGAAPASSHPTTSSRPTASRRPSPRRRRRTRRRPRRKSCAARQPPPIPGRGPFSQQGTPSVNNRRFNQPPIYNQNTYGQPPTSPPGEPSYGQRAPSGQNNLARPSLGQLIKEYGQKLGREMYMGGPGNTAAAAAGRAPDGQYDRPYDPRAPPPYGRQGPGYPDQREPLSLGELIKEHGPIAGREMYMMGQGAEPAMAGARGAAPPWMQGPNGPGRGSATYRQSPYMQSPPWLQAPNTPLSQTFRQSSYMQNSDNRRPQREAARRPHREPYGAGGPYREPRPPPMGAGGPYREPRPSYVGQPPVLRPSYDRGAAYGQRGDSRDMRKVEMELARLQKDFPGTSTRVQSLLSLIGTGGGAGRPAAYQQQPQPQGSRRW
ncbi:hypothetical protein JL720_7520 [Aureococcus anophagefferens]|nr:hypothetical protein JL720_7520 [Aureococcus anophagefferens]